MTKTVYVTGDSMNNRVALWEINKDHPTGEVYIVNDGKTHEVAMTDAVRRLIEQGDLKEVEAPAPAKIVSAPVVEKVTVVEPEPVKAPAVTNFSPVNRGGRPPGSKSK